ncbi:hypothetical protein PHMEG_00022304 [Phytophthora megakarya]|uniref:Uncharacterized protein n=1 Tax=Phytophthora megakarya TaxID=4795 RepID=A0A225VJS6_9STRA|nr:hypothetical protein PHMEG_00022304 [Phytophthora megakarya]
MTPDVSDGLGSGVESLVRNWELLSLYFDDFEVQLQRQEKIGSDSLIATTSTTLTLSSRSLRQGFPHLNSDKEGGIYGGKWSALAIKLLDQRIVVHSSVRFDWDNTREQVGSIQSQSDLLTPLLHLLGNLEDVSRVFHNARITPDMKVKPLAKDG